MCARLRPGRVLWLAAIACLATTVVMHLTGPPFQAWLNGTAMDSSIRAMLLAPALILFARAVRHHGVEPELAEAREPGAAGGMAGGVGGLG